MTDTKLSWQGSTKILDVPKARIWAPWYVAEYRLRNMSKWLGAIVAFGLGNPVLYLLSVGIGIGASVCRRVGGPLLRLLEANERPARSCEQHDGGEPSQGLPVLHS